MKSLTILITLLLAMALSINNLNNEIKITVSNISSAEGKIMIGLYTQDNFMKAPLQHATATIRDGKATVTFTEVPNGTYAVIAHHDSNDNDRMDFEPSGMPKEDYGTSNNPFSMGPPNWNESKFEVTDKQVSLEIRF